MKAKYRTSFLFFVLFFQCLFIHLCADEARFAIVIGNSNYQGQPLLNNSKADASEVAQALHDLGFHVTLEQDVSREALLSSISQFSNQLTDTAECIFYYSGHAFQVGGVNYIAPVDFSTDIKNDVEFKAVALERIFNALSKTSGAKVILLDSCRNNPYKVADFPGLAKPQDGHANTFISFSTAPGTISSDGVGTHSPFTEAFLKSIYNFGMPIEEVFKEVRISVINQSKGSQIPWEESSLKKSFCFRPPVTINIQFTGCDDDAAFILDGSNITSWGNDKGKIKQATLNVGKNIFQISVYNQKSYTGGIPGLGGHLPEGWYYSCRIQTEAKNIIATYNDIEDRPQDNGPHHGKWFTVVEGIIEVDSKTGEISLSNVDTKAWQH